MTSIKAQYESLQAKAKAAGLEVRLCMARPETFADRDRFVRLSEAPTDIRSAMDTYASILDDPDLPRAVVHLAKADALEAEAKPFAEQRDRLLALATSLMEEAGKAEDAVAAKNDEAYLESLKGNGTLRMLQRRHRLTEPSESVTFEPQA